MTIDAVHQHPFCVACTIGCAVPGEVEEIVRQIATAGQPMLIVGQHSFAARELAVAQYLVVECSLVVELGVEEQELPVEKVQLTRGQVLVIRSQDPAIKYNWAPKQDLVS